MNTEDDSEAETEEPYYTTVKIKNPYYSTVNIMSPDACTIELRKNTAYAIPPQLPQKISVKRNPAYASVSEL